MICILTMGYKTKFLLVFLLILMMIFTYTLNTEWNNTMISFHNSLQSEKTNEVSNNHKTITEFSNDHATTNEVSSNHKSTTEVSSNHKPNTDVNSYHKTTTEISSSHKTTSEISRSHSTTTEISSNHASDSMITTTRGSSFNQTSVTLSPQISNYGTKFCNEIKLSLKNQDNNLHCKPSEIKFLKKPRPFVGLPSFPGSGNTWARELIEDLTGIYTGAIYRDVLSTFPGSKICPWLGKIFIVKTHLNSNEITHPLCKKPETRYQRKRHFYKAIYILRNPYDAILAEYNRRHGGKTKTTSRKMFESSGWKGMVTSKIRNWEKSVLYWVKTFKYPLHILVYEQLVQNKCEALMEIAEFLQFDVSSQTMKCILNTEKSQYKRVKPSWLNIKTLYSDQLKSIVNDAIYNVLKKVDKTPLYETIKGYILK